MTLLCARRHHPPAAAGGEGGQYLRPDQRHVVRVATRAGAVPAHMLCCAACNHRMACLALRASDCTLLLLQPCKSSNVTLACQPDENALSSHVGKRLHAAAVLSKGAGRAQHFCLLTPLLYLQAGIAPTVMVGGAHTLAPTMAVATAGR